MRLFSEFEALFLPAEQHVQADDEIRIVTRVETRHARCVRGGVKGAKATERHFSNRFDFNFDYLTSWLHRYAVYATNDEYH